MQNSTDSNVLFLDELDAASPTIQAVMYQIVLGSLANSLASGRIKLPDDFFIVVLDTANLTDNYTKGFNHAEL